MKILVISNMYPSDKDPVYGTFVESFVKNIKYLNESGKTSIIVIKGRDGNKIQKIIKYINFYISILFSLSFKRYDLIYIHTITYPIPPILLVSKLKKLPLVFNVHGADVLTRSRLAEILKKKSISLLKEAKLIISPSNFFKNILLREFPFLEKEKIFISPSGGVDCSFFNKKKKKNDIFTIGYVSRIDKSKGWDTFLKAIAIIKQKDINIKGKIAGRGAETNLMLNLIDNLELNNEVDYIGPIPYAQLPNIYSQLDLFIFPTSLEESLGLVGLEAMASNVAVIGSKIGGLQDYIKSNYNGYFFETNNEFDLAKKICNFISLDPQDKNKLEENAYNTATKYESNIINQKLYDKLKSII